MIPYLLAIAGGYLIGSSMKKDLLKFANGGRIGDEGFRISQMKELLNKMFPYSFGFSVNSPKKGTRADFDFQINDSEPYKGLSDEDIKSKLYFPQYKRDHSICWKIYQGGENTYFYFILEDENSNAYIGQFGFKDEGDVDSSYITRFIAFLMEQYGLPFEVKHEIMAKGGGISDTPKVYIADLAAYNEGKLIGQWIDLSDYDSGYEVLEKIDELMKKWSKEQGVEREEWAVHDYENFSRSLYSEYMGEKDFDKVIEIYKLSESKDIPQEVLASIVREYDPSDLEEFVDDKYVGYFDNETDLAYNYIDEIGGLDNFSDKENYFDYEALGRDLAINDYYEFDGHYFRNYKKGGKIPLKKYMKGGYEHEEKLEIEFDEEKDAQMETKINVSYELEINDEEIQIYGELKKNYSKDSSLIFEPSFFVDKKSEDYYYENWEKIHEQIDNAYYKQ